MTRRNRTRRRRTRRNRTRRFRTRRCTRRNPVIASGAAVVVIGSPGPGASTSSSTPGSPIGPGSQHFELHSRTAIKIVVPIVAAILRRILRPTVWEHYAPVPDRPLFVASEAGPEVFEVEVVICECVVSEVVSESFGFMIVVRRIIRTWVNGPRSITLLLPMTRRFLISEAVPKGFGLQVVVEIDLVTARCPWVNGPRSITLLLPMTRRLLISEAVPKALDS
jgi:hypothetical protein